MRKRAQAAMEFLMTYGWAILVVIVAVGFMSYFGVIGKGYLLPERCSISTSSGLFCEDFSASTGIIILKIRNAFVESVKVTNASVSQDGNSCNLTTSVTIEAKSSGYLTLSRGPTCIDLTLPGKKLKSSVSITFIRKYLSRTARGDMVAKIGEGYEGVSYDICENAQESGLCGGLDVVFGLGYRDLCCSEHELCC